MVETKGARNLPTILIVYNSGCDSVDSLLQRLVERNQVDSQDLIWRFDTKYYTADVQIELFDGEDFDKLEELKIEAVVYLFKENKEICVETGGLPAVIVRLQ